MVPDAAQLTGLRAFWGDGAAAPAAVVLLLAVVAQWLAGRRDQKSWDAERTEMARSHADAIEKLRSSGEARADRILIVSERLLGVSEALEKRAPRAKTPPAEPKGTP